MILVCNAFLRVPITIGNAFVYNILIAVNNYIAGN